MKVDILELIKKEKLKTHKLFLEDFYNGHFNLVTSNRQYVNAAYKYKDVIGLNVRRLDYSNRFKISLNKGE